jgi:hypothetical protein
MLNTDLVMMESYVGNGVDMVLPYFPDQRGGRVGVLQGERVIPKDPQNTRPNTVRTIRVRTKSGFKYLDARRGATGPDVFSPSRRTRTTGFRKVK